MIVANCVADDSPKTFYLQIHLHEVIFGILMEPLFSQSLYYTSIAFKRPMQPQVNETYQFHTQPERVELMGIFFTESN